MGKKRNRRKNVKTNLIFDANERKDFLRGFKKRKDDRRLKAQEEMKLRIKDEKIRMKEKEKELVKKIFQLSDRDVESLQHLVPKDEDNEEQVQHQEISEESEEAVKPILDKTMKKQLRNEKLQQWKKSSVFHSQSVLQQKSDRKKAIRKLKSKVRQNKKSKKKKKDKKMK